MVDGGRRGVELVSTWTAETGHDDLVIDLDLPEVWEEASVDPAVAPPWLERLEASGAASEQVDRLRVALRTLAVEARAEGLVWAASFLAELDPEAEDAEILAASAFVAVRPPGRLDGVLSSVLWVAALEDAHRRRELRLLKPPTSLAIGDLDVAKGVVLTSIPATEHGPAFDVVDVTYYVTVPECPQIVVLGFRTPCTWVAEEFEDLFDDVAATMRARAEAPGEDG